MGAFSVGGGGAYLRRYIFEGVAYSRGRLTEVLWELKVSQSDYTRATYRMR